MDTYVILRRSGWRSPEELQEAAETPEVVADDARTGEVRPQRDALMPVVLRCEARSDDPQRVNQTGATCTSLLFYYFASTFLV